MKRKLLSKTTVWKYEDCTVVHTMNKQNIQPIFFSKTPNPFEWDNGGFVEMEDVTPVPTPNHPVETIVEGQE